MRQLKSVDYHITLIALLSVQLLTKEAYQTRLPVYNTGSQLTELQVRETYENLPTRNHEQTLILPLTNYSRPNFKKIDFSTMIYRYPNMSRFFQGFPRELNFNILIHVVTHIYKLIGEEIVW